jgi:hypothetical protein
MRVSGASQSFDATPEHKIRRENSFLRGKDGKPGN